MNARKNYSRDVQKMQKARLDIPAPCNIPSAVIPPVERLKATIYEVTNSAMASIPDTQAQHDWLKKNVQINDCLAWLKQKYNITSVPCPNGIVISQCRGFKSNHCKKTLVARFRTGKKANLDMCSQCIQHVKNEVRSKKLRAINYKQQVAPSSRTRYDTLTASQKKVRRNNERQKTFGLKRTIDVLKKKFEEQKPLRDLEAAKYREERGGVGIDLDTKSSKRNHENFVSTSIMAMKIILNEKEKFVPQLEEVLYDLFERGVTAEEKTNGYAFNPADVKDIVDQILEQMSNQIKILVGKSKQCKFSPATYQIAHALYSRSPAHFREFQALSAFHYPSEKSHKKLKSINHASGGRGSKIYEMYLSTKFRRNEGNTQYYGYLMNDELKIHENVVWGTWDGLAVGLASDMLDLRSVLQNLLSEEGHAVEKARYVNQWLYVRLDVKKYEKVMVGFWFNDGTLSGDTLFNQFMNVVLSLESIGCAVLGVVQDAGGSNASFVMRLRKGKSISSKDLWLDEKDCYVINFYDTSRRIYFYFCVTHLSKSMRGQLLASQAGHSKAFRDADGTALGWAVLIEFFTYMKSRVDAKIFADVCPINEKVVYPEKQVAMNVTVCLKSSHDNTLDALTTVVQRHPLLNTTKIAIDAETSGEKLKLPFKGTRSENNHHPFMRHASHLVEVRYLKDLAKRREEVLYVLQDIISAIFLMTLASARRTLEH